MAELVAADPLDACSTHKNAAPLRGRVVLVKRGQCPLATKALLAQRAGALGVVIADNGKCTALDQYCVPGADRSRGEAWARLDLQRPWAGVHIPVVLVLADSAAHVLEHFPFDGMNACHCCKPKSVVADESAGRQRGGIRCFADSELSAAAARVVPGVLPPQRRPVAGGLVPLIGDRS